MKRRAKACNRPIEWASLPKERCVRARVYVQSPAQQTDFASQCAAGSLFIDFGQAINSCELNDFGCRGFASVAEKLFDVWSAGQRVILAEIETRAPWPGRNIEWRRVTSTFGNLSAVNLLTKGTVLPLRVLRNAGFQH